MTKQERGGTVIWRMLFLMYSGVMLWLLFGRSSGWIPGVSYEIQLQQNANLEPLFTIRNYLYVLQFSSDEALRQHCIINLAGNVFLFVPAGWLIPTIWPRLRHFFRFFAFSLGLIFLIETTQLFTLLGSFDVDDIILNLIGMVAGHILHAIICPQKKI